MAQKEFAKREVFTVIGVLPKNGKLSDFYDIFFSHIFGVSKS